MGFSIEMGVSALAVFLEGLASFLSPCVLPLIPLYIGYLAGGTKTVQADGSISYPRKKVFLNTLCFVFGIALAFFLLGLAATAFGSFLKDHRVLFSRIGGIVIILFGLFQLGVFGSRFLSRERRLPLNLSKIAINPLLALVMGFTFSFAWTPCVGPLLGSVLLMASSAASAAKGFLLIGVYTLGFILPFLAVGIFTSTLLRFFKKHQKIVRYTVKIGGILMIVMGIMLLTGWMNGITSYLSRFTDPGTTPSSSQTISSSPSAPEENEGASSTGNAAEESEEEALPAFDFTLTDQFGNSHTLSDYKGKVVFLNFWATWCPPCKAEMPDIQDLFEIYGENSGDVIFLGVANPKTDENPQNQDGTVSEVTKFLSDNGYTYPVVMDLTGETFSAYGIYSFPTTFMIDRDGNVFGYATGMLSRDIMESIIKQTMEGKRK